MSRDDFEIRECPACHAEIWYRQDETYRPSHCYLCRYGECTDALRDTYPGLLNGQKSESDPLPVCAFCGKTSSQLKIEDVGLSGYQSGWYACSRHAKYLTDTKRVKGDVIEVGLRPGAPPPMFRPGFEGGQAALI